MRESKSRGKRIDNDEWVYGWYVDRRRHSYILPICNENDPHPTFDESWQVIGSDDDGWFEVDPETVGQFTGPSDKNGKEIYFDDIVIWNKKKYVVMWSKTCLGIYLEHLDSYLARQKDPKLGKFIENLMYGRAVYLEIIGTVHEHPKLLEAKNG